MNILEYLQQNIIYLDGAMGSLLQMKGLKKGELPEEWNLSHSDDIVEIHKSYYDSGSNIVCTNTFGANTLKFSREHLKEIILSAVENAKKARDLSISKSEKFIAGDIGPLGKLLKPFGDLDFEDAVNIFKETAVMFERAGVDLVIIETMNDSYETKAALLAVKESTNLPVFVTNAYSENKKLMTGASPKAMVSMLEGLGADAIGLNCSLGPKDLLDVIKEIYDSSSIPVIFKPNAGLPKVINGVTTYDVDAKSFASEVKKAVEYGIRIVGGCCGTTPEYISELVNITKDILVKEIEEKEYTIVSSGQKEVVFDNVVLVGERINPTGNKKIKEAILENDIDKILSEAINEQDHHAHILDVNVGVPGIDEKQVLTTVVKEVQSVVNLPLSIDSSNPAALESALRIYNGKPLINSVNGKLESMETVFPLVKKYGGVVVALTLDENGIPFDINGRLEIAKRILSTAQNYGINKKDIIFDTLTMSISTNKEAGNITAGAVKKIKEELHCHTILGVSNISFGMPDRDEINSKFFSFALQMGLSSAIMNPYSVKMMKSYEDFEKNNGLDVSFSDTVESTMNEIEKSISQDESDYDSPLQFAIIRGLKEKAHVETEKALKKFKGLDVVTNEIIPALDIVGKGYEDGKVYLPQLLMAAEAAKSAFDVIKSNISTNKEAQKGKLVIATVKGDVHDIGKNIVKLLLQNYGFEVIDLGKDVEPKLILETVINNKVKLVCLSALMTTTVPSMEDTIKLLRENVEVKVCVGGAVLTEEYAQSIGADKYCKDAMDTVRYAKEILE